MRIKAVLAGLILATACGDPAPTGVSTPIVQPTNPFPPDTGAILAGDAALGLAHQCSRISPGPVAYVWTPDASQIAALEAALPPLIEAELKQKWPNETLQAASYYRQYAGLVISGRRIIYVNAVERRVVEGFGDTRTPDERWRSKPFGICDGGPITFGVEYDPQAKTFANFAFNGAL